jgi:CRISPR type I-E-associated protein CasB/Cse2
MTEAGTTPEEQFIARIERLDTGRLAMLRRGCGERDPVEGRCPWMIGLIHGIASEPAAFLVASLLAQYKTTDIRAGHHRLDGNFGLTWRRAVTGNGSESIKRRFNVLLDSSYDPRSGDGDLPYRLRQMVRYAAGKGVGVDWPALVRDIRDWNSPSKWAQKKWARSFFADERSEKSEASSKEKE